MKRKLVSQISACVYKDALLQFRRPLGVLALGAAPFVALAILIIAQNSISKHVDVDAFKCGCNCLACYNSTEVEPCTPSGSCSSRDNGTCSFLYSSVNQAPFCDVRQPPLWPPLMQIPPDTLDTGYIAYTGGSELDSTKIMNSFFPDSSLVASKVAESYVKSMVLDEIESIDSLNEVGGTGAAENPEELEFIEATGALCKGLHDFGVNLATSDISSGTLLLERALMPDIEEKKLYLLQYGQSKGSDIVMSSIQKSIANLTGILHVTTLNILFKFFNSSDDINNAIFQDWGDMGAKIVAAYDWHGTNASNLQVDIWANTPRVYSPMDIPDIQRWAQSINIASNAYIKNFFDGSVNLAGVRDMPRQSSVLNIDFSTLLGPLFSMWLMHAILPLHLNSLVYEKELELRIFQHINGLRPLAYYASKFWWNMTLYTIYISCFVGFGILLGLKMFTKNIISIQIAFFGLWGVVIISFGFLYASFFQDRRSGALSSVFYILIMGFLANVVLVLLIEQENNVLTTVLQFLVPSFCAFRGMYYFGECLRCMSFYECNFLLIVLQDSMSCLSTPF